MDAIRANPKLSSETATFTFDEGGGWLVEGHSVDAHRSESLRHTIDQHLQVQVGDRRRVQDCPVILIRVGARCPATAPRGTFEKAVGRRGEFPIPDREPDCG